MDEFDKLIRSVSKFFNKLLKKNDRSSSEVTNEGVQNNFLPLLDGSDVPVREGRTVKFTINTRNILFVALGAFNKKKPTDLIAEIQGRLPIMCKVEALTSEDFKNILIRSKCSVLNQVTQMLQAEGLIIELSDDAITELANISFKANQMQDDTGARRLVSVINKITEDLSFHAPEIFNEYSKEGCEVVITLTKEYVKEKCKDILSDYKDKSKYVI